MIKAYQQPTRRGGATGPFLSYTKQEYRRGYEIPGMAYQTGGIRSLALWNTRQTILRILPGYDPATGQIYPQNINVNEFSMDAGYDDYLSDTFITASVVSGFGANKQTFITSYAPGSDDAQRYGGDTVINQFVKNVANSVLNAEKGKRSKFQVTDDMRRWCAKDGPIKFPRQALLFQALVFKRNGLDSQDANQQPLLDENGNVLPLLTVVSVDGKQTLLEVMKALVDPANPGLPLNPATNSKFGALAETEGNILYLNPIQDPTTGARFLRPSVQDPIDKGWNPTPFPLDEETVKQLWVPWDDLLQYMTAEEQCKFLAQEFGSDSVNYFIGTDPMFNSLQLPQEIANAGLGRYARFVSGSQATSFAPQRPAASSPARASFGIPKQAAAGVTAQGSAPAAPKAPAFGTPRQSPAEQALAAGYTPAPTPKGRPNGLAGLRANAAIDQDKLKAALGGIHRAQQSNQASMAQSLLNDNDLADYQDPELDYVDDNLGDQEAD